MPHPADRLEVVICLCCAVQFYCEENNVTRTQKLTETLLPKSIFNIHILDTKHLDTAWPVDTASFRRDWVWETDRVLPSLLKFFRIRQMISLILYIIFNSEYSNRVV